MVITLIGSQSLFPVSAGTYVVDVKIKYLYLSNDGDSGDKGELAVWYRGYQDDITDREDTFTGSIDGETVQQTIAVQYGDTFLLKLTDYDGGGSYQTLLQVTVTIKTTTNGFLYIVGRNPVTGFGLHPGNTIGFGGSSNYGGANSYSVASTASCPLNPGYGNICNGFDISISVWYSGGGGE